MGVLNERADVLTDPQVLHNAVMVTVPNGSAGRVRVARAAALFDGQPQQPDTGAGRLGEHGLAVLAELGYSAEQIDRLVADGVVKLPKAP